jgi:acyl dehydratase
MAVPFAGFSAVVIFFHTILEMDQKWERSVTLTRGEMRARADFFAGGAKNGGLAPRGANGEAPAQSNLRTGDMRQVKYYWEDFRPGEVAEFGEKTVSKEEIVEFASEFDPQPFHLDEEAGRQSILGGLCASGWHSCAMMMRMMCDAYILESASMGAPGVDEVRWKKPVYAGDTIRLRRTCLERRVSKSRPEMGLTRFRLELVNQKGEVAVSSEGWAMYGRRHPDAVVEEA